MAIIINNSDDTSNFHYNTNNETKKKKTTTTKKKRCCCGLSYLACSFFIGAFFLMCAIFTYFSAGLIMKYQIHQNIILRPNSKAYDFWTKPPAKILREYYIFDVQNPEQVKEGLEKPRLVQRGPYTYSERWQKMHVDFMGDDLVSYVPTITLHFEPSLSRGNESDLVTFLNVPAVAMIEQGLKSKSKLIQPAAINELNRMLKTKLFETKTVGELIGGYKDPLMTLAKLFLPKLIKDNKFSLVNGKNGTEWQNYTIMTGKDLAENVAKIVNWNGVEKLNYWYTESANLINGTDGTYYRPFRTKEQRLYSFNPDMCRSYYLTYLKENKIDGIKLYDFHLPPNIFYNSTLNPENEGFCHPKDKCFGNGVQNISSCYGGVSGFVSQPHFLNADQHIIDSVSGLNPNSEEHDFVLHFEPVTGVPISGAIRLQINFFMPQSDKIDLVKKVKPILFPVFWFNDTYVMDQNITNQLATVALMADLSVYIPIVFAAIGLLIVPIYPFVYFRRRHMRKCVDKVNVVTSNGTSSSSSSSFEENASLINNKV